MPRPSMFTEMCEETCEISGRSCFSLLSAEYLKNLGSWLRAVVTVACANPRSAVIYRQYASSSA
jgi:hypothetical protein